MPNLSGTPVVIGQTAFKSTANGVHYPGQSAVTRDGRKFRYVQAGGANLVPGTLQQSAALLSHVNLIPQLNPAIGATEITVTLAVSAVTADFYAGGLLTVSNGTSQGYSYTISGHPAQTSSTGNVVISLDKADALLVALVTTSDSRVDLTPCPYRGVIKSPQTTKTGVSVGVAVYPVLAGEYGWIQTGGHVNCLIEGTPAAGAVLQPSVNVAGALVTSNVTVFNAPVASAIVTGVDANSSPVFLTIN